MVSLSHSDHTPLILALMMVVLVCHSVTVTAVIEFHVSPVTNFTLTLNTLLFEASADEYFVHLAAGVYTGCGSKTIDLGPGLALSVTITGAGVENTTIDCADVVLTSPVFTCGQNCTAHLQNATLTHVRMTTASPDNVGALMNVFDGASVFFESVQVSSCWVVPDGDFLSPYLSQVSSVVRISGEASIFTAVDTSFLNNTGEVGSISTVDYGQVSVSKSLFESNVGGGGAATEGKGGVFSLSGGAVAQITQSIFILNSAWAQGGVAYLYDDSVVTFENVVCEDSIARYGGVTYSSNSGVNFVNVTAQGSTARSDGGVVFSSYSVVNFFNAIIQDSSAVVNGGVVHSSYGNVSFVNTSSHNSTSASAGFLHSSEDHTQLMNVIIHRSSTVNAAGVMSISNTVVDLIKVIIGDSMAGSQGGFCLSDNSEATLVDVVIHNSTAGTPGGVIYSVGGGLTLINVAFWNSSGGADGGLAYVGSGSAYFRNVTAHDSFAGQDEFLFVIQGSQVIAQYLSISSQLGGVFYAGLHQKGFIPSTLSLESSGLSCSDSVSCIRLDESNFVANDTDVFFQSGVGVSASVASLNVVRSSFSGERQAAVFDMFQSTIMINQVRIDVASEGLGVFSFFFRT